MKQYTVSGSPNSTGTTSLSLMGTEFTIRGKGGLDDADLEIAVEIFKQAVKRKSTKKKIEIEHTYLGERNIPVLRCYPAAGKNLPTVIFVHGYTGHKALDTGRGMQLAEAGFHSIVLDARMHGERKPDDFQRRFMPDRWVSSFFNVLKGTAQDISAIIDLLSQDERTDENRVGLTGISMGGFTTFLTALREKRLKAVAPMIGSPDLLTFERNPGYVPIDEKLRKALINSSALVKYGKLARCAVLVQNGAKDKTVSVQGSRKLDKVMKKRANTREINYRYIEYPDLGHDVSDEMMAETLKWFSEYL